MVLLVSLLLVFRLYQLQIMQHDRFVARAEQQYVHTVEDLYTRGSILLTTRDGERVSAATVQGGYVLAINPQHVTDPEALYAELAPHIALERDTFIARAGNTARTYVEIEQRVDTDTADAIEALDLPGVLLFKNQWRYYPGGTLGARTIGFVAFGGDAERDTLSGRYGLERYYDDVLAHDTERLSVNFFAEIFSTVGSMVFDADTHRNGDVVTSLEPTVLRTLSQELAATHEEWGSTLTGGIIMNPQTGEIYAMDVVPTFDLNDRAGATINDFRSPLVEDVYEMGSIIKALTMAAGLDSGAVSAGTTYYDPGTIELNTYTISNYDGRGRGTVDMQEVLNQSLNTGVAFVVNTMGKQRFREYFQKLRIGSETGIDLPNEAHGLVDNLDSPRDVEYATASFGQGIALTPIATARALATLGNGGTLITPHIATAIEYDDGAVKEIQYPEGDRVFSEETSEEISRMLTTVVDDALRGGDVALEQYSVAAKTGTAQIADTRNGGYYDDRYLHSFFGYFPSYDPQFLVLLYTVEPKNVRYASETLTEPFMDITKFLINYYNLPPDR